MLNSQGTDDNSFSTLTMEAPIATGRATTGMGKSVEYTVPSFVLRK